jgi:hypothetical protein
MSVKSLLGFAIALIVATPFYALADSFNAKTGAWEITAITLTKDMLIPAEALANMPPEKRAEIEKMMQARAGKPSTHVRKSCVTQQKLDQDRMITSDDEEQCKKKIISKSANKLVIERTCPEPHAYTAKWVIEAKTPESLAASMDVVQSGGGKVHVDIKGRWLGASCAGIKDDS